jgi:hypothetical protein
MDESGAAILLMADRSSNAYGTIHVKAVAVCAIAVRPLLWGTNAAAALCARRYMGSGFTSRCWANRADAMKSSNRAALEG